MCEVCEIYMEEMHGVTSITVSLLSRRLKVSKSVLLQTKVIFLGNVGE